MLQKRLASAIAAGALLLNLATPAFAAEITISGNGDSSDNTADVKIEQSSSVVQNNDAKVKNDIKVDSDTGNNDANRNTGGDVDIDTGNASTNVTVDNTLNSNSATLDCCPSNGNTELKISGNGVDSDNDIKLDQKSNTGIFQDNKAHVDNKVDVDSDTGNNDANRNTGGSVSITTGDADVTVGLSTTANANLAVLGGSGGGGSAGKLSAWIVGNGDSSDNDIDVKIDSAQAIDQDNDAKVKNEVKADADTGNNDANRNTGGDVDIDTGDATVDVTVDNLLNFNSADLNCGCLLNDWELKISGNGVDTDNDIKLNLKDDKKNGVFQDNKAHLDNKLKDIDADTGDNDANRNTGDPDGDPSVTTGDADATVDVSNTLNANSVGDADWEFPGADVHFSFDLGDLLDWLLAHS